jgi:bacteriocin-like protein
MSTQKDTTEHQPKAPQTGELDEKQLNTVTGGALLTYQSYAVSVGGTKTNGPSSNGPSA